MDSENVPCARRREFALLLTGELDALIARGVRLDSVMVEDHREDGDGLPDRLLPESRVREFSDESRDVLRGEIGDGDLSEAGEESSESDAVGLRGPLGDVHTRRLPGFRELAERRSALRLTKDSRASRFVLKLPPYVAVFVQSRRYSTATITLARFAELTLVPRWIDGAPTSVVGRRHGPDS